MSKTEISLTDSSGFLIDNDNLFLNAGITPDQLVDICPDDYHGYRAAVLYLLYECRKFYAAPKAERKHHSITFVNMAGFDEEEKPV